MITWINEKCFAAGTLVHTKEGLRPIEEIKVGDWVLSQPEGKGELSYKQVTRTFVHEDTELWLLGVGCATEKDGEKQLFKQWVATTGNHPFFTKERGWVSAYDLLHGEKIEVADGSYAPVGCITKIFQTETPGLGWAPNDWDSNEIPYSGHTVEFVAGGIKAEHHLLMPEVSRILCRPGAFSIRRLFVPFTTSKCRTITPITWAPGGCGCTTRM